MNDALQQIESVLSEHICENGASEPLGTLGVFFCRQAQRLRGVPIVDPTVVLVIRGKKSLVTDSEQMECVPGELLLLPGDTTVALTNHPDSQHVEYLALAIAFSSILRERFLSTHANLLAILPQQHRWTVTAPDDLLVVLLQWLKLCKYTGKNDALIEHRQLELLLLLTQAGLAGRFLYGKKRRKPKEWAGPTWECSVQNRLWHTRLWRRLSAKRARKAPLSIHAVCARHRQTAGR